MNLCCKVVSDGILSTGNIIFNTRKLKYAVTSFETCVRYPDNLKRKNVETLSLTASNNRFFYKNA
jgi:hypothetical protein